ncbi:hypothetical protein GGH94_005786 [Coemansia aciculifera]|uniref:RRM domain-containing protein n=1 Tax=Coemansia aciculifera TaxID=417176 RepID=A0A9W8M3I6_9FUNG|nr:hypothetical protein GGH94_005786 [Coemansia aciculifera]
MAYSSPFGVPVSGAEFEFDELRRMPSTIDPSLIDRHSAGPRASPTAATFEAAQQIPPQLSHSHSFGQLQFSSTTSLSALSPPMHHASSSHQQPTQQMLLQSRLYLGDCAPAPSSSALPSLATPTSLSHPVLYPAFAPVQQQQGYLQQLPQMYASAAPVQLWMGDIEPWMDEDYIRIVWERLGEAVAVKIIRDRLTGAMANYCFIEVSTHADAERILALYNGKAMPSPSDRLFRLNWATGMALGTGYPQLLSFANAGALDSPGGVAASGNSLSNIYTATSGGLSLSAALDGPEYSLFVGDLAPEVTDVQLAHEFRSRYGSVRTAKVVTDPVTLLPRGYGFVRFADEADQQRALVEMQGQVIGSRTIRVSTATPKRTPTMTSFQQQYQQQQQTADGALVRDAAGSPALSESSSDSNALYNPATDPNNTTVFVGGLMHPVNEEELHSFFAVYGDVVYCKIPPNRGCGFVTFSKRGHAETAMRALNGHMLGGSRVRLSWGRSQSHARHNHRHHYHHHHHHHHHHRQQNSNGGSSSGANSHRNSVSDQHGLLSRRSVSLGKGIVAAAPSSTALGLGLSGASTSMLGMASQHGMTSADAVDEKLLPPPAMSSAYPTPLHTSLSSHAVTSSQHSAGSAGVNYPGALSHGHHQQQQQQHVLGGYSMTPHSAFYTLSPIHSVAASTTDDFGGGSEVARGGNSSTLLSQQYAGFPQQQQQQQSPYYYYQPQDQSMLATPITAHLHQNASDLSPSVAGHFSRQPHTLAMRSSGQFEGLHSMQQNMYGHQHDFRGGDAAGNGLSNTMLPSLAACPSDLLTRRLSALTLGSATHLGSNELQSFGGGPPPSAISASALVSAPTLNRRPSAGVIGQRRLSSKSSFYQPPHKSSSQLSMAQMWPTAVEHSGECNASGALSTPTSSARLSTSSLSYLAMTPSTLNHDHSGNDSGDSRRQSSDDKHKRDSQDQLNFALDGNTIRIN